MLQDLRLQNYRRFRDFRIDGLSRVNLFVGPNGGGKTSVLEAIQLFNLRDHPNELLGTLHRQAQRRGEGDVTSENGSSVRWRPLNPTNLFCGAGELLDDANVPGLSIASGDERVEFRIGPGVTEASDAIYKLARPSENGSDFLPRTRHLEWRSVEEPNNWQPVVPLVPTDQPPGRSKPYRVAAPNEVQEIGSPKARPSLSSAGPLSAEWIGTGRLRMTQRLRYWDRCVELDRREAVYAALQPLLPELEEILVRRADEGLARFDARIGSVVRPLPSLGEGVNRFFDLAVVLLSTSNRRGLLFLDEIDTGLHWSVMPNLWESLLTAALDDNLQVFATTHSEDCLRGLSDLHATHPELASVAAVFRVEPDRDYAVRYSAGEIEAAAEMRTEVRGFAGREWQPA